jgi:hypothetical protein
LDLATRVVESVGGEFAEGPGEAGLLVEGREKYDGEDVLELAEVDAVREAWG